LIHACLGNPQEGINKGETFPASWNRQKRENRVRHSMGIIFIKVKDTYATLNTQGAQTMKTD
jgi:hypothetical protein